MAFQSLNYDVTAVSGATDFSAYDGLVVVSPGVDSLGGDVSFVKSAVQSALELDKSVAKQPSVVAISGHALKRAVFSPTGPLNRDYDDVRRYGDAATAGMKRALEAGMKKPVLFTVPHASYQNASLVSLLGAMHGLYVPLELRERTDGQALKAKVETLGVWDEKKLIIYAMAIESGRTVYRDIGGSDPERMAPPNVVKYVKEIFGVGNSQVKVETISNLGEIEKNYPLFAAVNRCANRVDRHQGRIIKLTYQGDGPVTDTLLLVGKGVTYDTGGADVKYGGHMAGMHRDKCGSAFVAGFFQVLNILKPKNLKVIGRMAMVRNSIGADGYVADEIITSRAGVRVRVGNTDAEGRMAMADSLCEMTEVAAGEKNPHLFTIATLTGHAIRAVGPNYTLVLDNGPAGAKKFAQKIQELGHNIGDPFELSTIRREDYDFCRGKSEYEDVLQCNNEPSSATPRGHQFPAAFLIRSSGLDKYGLDSANHLKYTHLDIAGSSGPFPGIPTGAPIPAFVAKYLMTE